MKKIYESPIVEVMNFETENLIAASPLDVFEDQVTTNDVLAPEFDIDAEFSFE